MNSMFRGTPFTVDISSWNVSIVTDMGNMFNKSFFNEDIGKWNINSVTNCASFSKDGSLIEENTPKFTNCNPSAN